MTETVSDHRDRLARVAAYHRAAVDAAERALTMLDVPEAEQVGIPGIPTAVAAAFPRVFFRSPCKDEDGDLRLAFVYERRSGGLAVASVPYPNADLETAIREVVG